jgi:4-amino-4-deoxy-L-arabinose transferase-like glycosyltransferase
MFQAWRHRLGHYALLLALGTGLTLPNLGGPSLWDVDEGNNASAAREMLEAETWIVPTFNYQLRVDKPALLYWLQIAAYRWLDINELAARLPSALASIVSVLLTYELGRRMFSATTGLLAGIILASNVAFTAAAHFANPDALLDAATLAILFSFWSSFARNGRGWFIPAGICSGLAMLAKGPVGLVLPSTVIGLFLFGAGKLAVLRDRRVMAACLAFAVVAGPWYTWVAIDTKAEFLRGFFQRHNVGRFLSPMENHRGPLYYYVPVLALGFAPWSAFLPLAGWFSVGSRARQDTAATESGSELRLCYRLLWCWIGVYLVFFSAAATKLPNYILPIYPAVAILLARFFDRWRRCAILIPIWAFQLSIGGLALMGVGVVAGILIVSGVIPLPRLQDRQFAQLGPWAGVGLFLVGSALAAWSCIRRQYRVGLIASVTAGAVFFVGSLAAYASVALDAYKAPRALVEAAQARQTGCEVRVGAYQYFQPSLVFYCRREVQRLDSEKELQEFLDLPYPVFVFLPARVWQGLQPQLQASCRLLAQHHDLYRRCEVVAVTNRPRSTRRAELDPARRP